MKNIITANYDKIALNYIEHTNKQNSWNNLYERPAMLKLFADFANKTVLDAGCGSGFYTSHALSQGARVIAVDNSIAMVKHVTDQNNSVNLTAYQANLADGLPYLDDMSIDYIVSSLVMHYLKDWEGIAGEFYRSLKTGGKLYMSTHHPFSDWLNLKKESYFSNYLVDDTWGSSSNPIHVQYYTRSLEAIVGPFIKAGFRLVQLKEPLPDENCRRESAEAYAKLSVQPAFLFLVLSKS